MADQPRYEPFEASAFFADGASARPPVPGTVPRGSLEDPALTTGRTNEGLVSRSPVPVTMDLLRRGRERFNIYCAPCHGRIGRGEGMIVQRGFPQPRTFHDPRLRHVPDGHLFDVITNGLGKMPAYGDLVPAPDRWAIVSYVRALQRSQHATIQDVAQEERRRLDELPEAQ